jgi:hypothetical protein
MIAQKSKAELHHINQAACCIEVVPSLKKYKLPSNTTQIRSVSNLIEQKSITDPLAHYFAGMHKKTKSLTTCCILSNSFLL